MKTALFVMLLVIAMLSCLVDRKSEDFACADNSDCVDIGTDRECKEGFCVKAACPSQCDSCGVAAKTCIIKCDSPSECSNGVSCPAGYSCAIDCSRNCSPVTCTGATSCVVTCSGTNTMCGPLNCGTAMPCTCSGTGCQ